MPDMPLGTACRHTHARNNALCRTFAHECIVHPLHIHMSVLSALPVMCRRYGMPEHKVRDPAAAQTLASIAASQQDPELRADMVGNALLAPLLGEGPGVLVAALL